jgi:RNA polymerase sigma-70 factor (ECF subfamily)
VTELVARFRAGEPDAIRELYREYGAAVMTVARSVVRDRELAADVVQQTFVKAWRAAATFDGSRELAPWLYSIARNTAIDTVRSQARQAAVAADPDIEIHVEGESLERTWERYEVRRAIDALPPDEREVVRRSHLFGHTHEQIAQQLGVPVGTVKSRSGRAHKRLASALRHLTENRTSDPTVLDRKEEA